MSMDEDGAGGQPAASSAGPAGGPVPGPAPGGPIPWPPAPARPGPYGPGSAPATPARPGPDAPGVSTPVGAGVSQRPPGGGGAYSPSQMATAMNALDERIEVLGARVVGVETAQRTLTEDASRAMRDLILRAQNEIGAQEASLTILRDDVTQEAGQVRGSLQETRSAMELLYANTQGEFINIQQAINMMIESQKMVQVEMEKAVGREVGRRWEELKAAIAAEAAARAVTERQAGAGPMPPGLPVPAAFMPDAAHIPVDDPDIGAAADEGLASAGGLRGKGNWDRWSDADWQKWYADWDGVQAARAELASASVPPADDSGHQGPPPAAVPAVDPAWASWQGPGGLPASAGVPFRAEAGGLPASAGVPFRSGGLRTRGHAAIHSLADRRAPHLSGVSS